MTSTGPNPIARRRARWAVYGVAGALLIAAVVVSMVWLLQAGSFPGDPRDHAQVAAGEQVYATQCATCHGADLKGDPDWQSRLPNRRFRPPPHDDTGHTWHHPDPLLFAITKNGLIPPVVPEGYESDMPAFAGKLTDGEIWAVLAFIKSRWSKETRAHQKWMTEDAARK